MLEFKKEYFQTETNRHLYPTTLDLSKAEVYGCKDREAYMYKIPNNRYTSNAGNIDFSLYPNGVWSDYTGIKIVERLPFFQPSINFNKLGDITPSNLNKLKEEIKKHIVDLETAITESVNFIDSGVPGQNNLPYLPEGCVWFRDPIIKDVIALPITELYGKFNQMIDELRKILLKLLDKDYNNTLLKFLENVKKELERQLSILAGAGSAFKPKQVANIEILKNVNAKVDEVYEVLGYYRFDDGATHKRKIAREDDGSGVQLNNKLWANIVHNREINIKWAGAKGDGKTDDTIAFQKVLSMKNNGHLIGGTIKIPVGIFIISETLNVGAINIVGQSNYSYDLKYNYGNSSVIRWNGAENSFMLKGEEDSVWSLKNLIFDGNSVNWKTDASITPDIVTNEGRSQYSWTFTKNNVSGVDLWDAGNSVIDCCYFYNFSGLALNQSKSAGYIILSNLHFWYCNVALRLVFDTTASNLKFFNCVRGIEMTNGGANNLNNLRFDGIAEYPIYLTETNRNIITNIVVDQINWAAICLDSHSRGNIITGDFTRSAKYYASIPIDKVKKEEIGRACAVYFTGENSSENHIICNIQKGPFDDRTEQTHYTPSIFVGYDGKWHQMNVIEIASQSLVLYNHNLYKNPQIISENLVYCQKNIKPEPIVSAPCDTIILNGENIKYSFINNQFRVIYNNRLLSSSNNGVNILDELWIRENEGLEYWDGETIYKILKDETHEGWIKFVKIYEKPTPAQQLNSIYHLEKMKQENVYDDYITYMDEKTAYDNQQKEIKKQIMLSYQEALKENPNLTYEEFMSLQPMTLNLVEEPQPSARLQEFMDKYL